MVVSSTSTDEAGFLLGLRAHDAKIVGLSYEEAELTLRCKRVDGTAVELRCHRVGPMGAVGFCLPNTLGESVERALSLFPSESPFFTGSRFAGRHCFLRASAARPPPAHRQPYCPISAQQSSARLLDLLQKRQAQQLVSGSNLSRDLDACG